MTKSELIQKIRARYFEEKRLEAVVLRHYKSDLERANAVANLIEDDIVQEGVHPDSELAAILRAELTIDYIRKLNVETRSVRTIDRGPLSDDFTRGEF